MPFVLIILCFLTCFAKASEKSSDFKGSSELSYLTNSGNTQTETFSTATSLSLQLTKWEHLLRTRYIRVADNDETTSRQIQHQYKAARLFGLRTSLFLSTQYDKNIFSGIDQRLTYETGIGYSFIKKERLNWTLSLGVGHIDERRINTSNMIERESFTTISYSSLFSWDISKSTRFDNQIKYITNTESSEDWRYENISSLSTILTDIFSVKASYTSQKLNSPPDGKRKTDSISTISLVAKF